MSKLAFCELDKANAGEWIPQVFDILYTNMSQIAPTGNARKEDQAMWQSYFLPALEQGKIHVVLAYAGETLAGYCQYSVRGDTVLVEEVEIKPEYQRSMVFYRLCQFMLQTVPENVRYLEAYADKRNRDSLPILKTLEMRKIGQNKSGTGWHFRGELAKAAERFRR